MELSGPYDSQYIQPIVRIKERLAILTGGKWQFYTVDFQEPIPPTPASQVEMVAASGATTLAALGTIAKRVVTILQLNNLEFLHLRWKPLDYVEGLLWERPSSLRMAAANIVSRVDPFVRDYDPTWATTTFWILGGREYDMNLEVRNPTRYATPVARFQFWGDRSLLSKLDLDALASAQAQRDSAVSEEQTRLVTSYTTRMAAGDKELVSRIIGPVAWVPAEGQVS